MLKENILLKKYKKIKNLLIQIPSFTIVCLFLRY